MKDSSLNDKVIKAIEAFESIAPLQPSVEWNELAIRRMEASGLQKKKTFTNGKLTAISMLFLLLNVGYLMTILKIERPSSENRRQDLKVISKELLINPSSVTN